MIRTLIFFLIIVGSIQAFCQKKNKNTKPYPFGNPVITHMYTADASPHVMPDGKVWMVTSVDLDEGGGYSTMHSYHTFSSSNMVDWVDHGEVYHISDIAPEEDPKVDDYALWAPDMIYENGKYYLYYPVHIRHRNDLNEKGNPKVTTFIGVAVSDAPDKKFVLLKDKIEGTNGIDPSVFRDDDGEIYLYWGQRWVAKLKSNMFELDTKPQKLDIGADNFMEAPWMHKRDGKYYFNYHTLYGKPVDPENPNDPKREKSQLDYSWGDSPIGPLSYGGVLNYELGYGVDEEPKFPGKSYVPWRLTQSNHGGVVTFHGKDYLFYHTSAVSSWRQDEFQSEGTWTQRSVCVDVIEYNEDGSVIPVKQTVKGVDPVTINQPFEIKLEPKKAEDNCGMKLKKDKLLITDKTSCLTFHNIDLGSGYYYFDLKSFDLIGSGKIEIWLDGPKTGRLIGTMIVDESIDYFQNKLSTSLIDAYGNHTVNLVIEGLQGSQISDIRFLAGSPQS